MVKSVLRELSLRLRDYIFPALCIVCDTPRATDDPWLCQCCKDRLHENHVQRNPCPRCAMNLAKGPCACQRGAWNHPFDSVYSICDFDPTVQAIMHQVKYRSRKALAYHLGAFLSDGIPSALFSGLSGVLAVPLHPKREKKRGYNQSLLFARGIAARHPDLVIRDRLLRRVKHTVSQTTLDRQQRAENMTGAFGVEPESAEQVRGRHLLLVDDVITTGATTAAAAAALLDAGCAGIRVLSIARD
jgi:competence protein ComFC